MYCHIHHCHYHHCNCVPTDSKEKGGALTQEELLALTEEMKEELKDYTVDLKDQIFSYIDIGVNPVEIANTFASLKEQDTYILRTLTNKIDELNNTTNLSMFNLRARVTNLESQSATLISDLVDRTERIEELESNTQVVESVADLSTVENPKDGLRVYVKSYHVGLGKGGGYFTYASTKASIDNGGTVINGWVRDKGVIDVFQFGARADNATEDSTSFQKAIDACNLAGGGFVLVPAGTYYTPTSITLKEFVQLKGAGSSCTILNQKTGSQTIILTPDVVENVLVQTSNLKAGDLSNDIANTCSKGDIIRFKSEQIFTQRWGSEGRTYYQEAEMMEVEEATPTQVLFNHPTFINCSVEDSVDVVYFTPTKGVGFHGITLRKSKDVINYSKGAIFNKVVDSFISDIRTENYDDAGISIARSLRVNTKDTLHIGGSDTLGLCYGTGYVDGSKHCKHIGIHGNGCRHTISAGGTGWALPCYNEVSNITSVNSTAGALDTHSNSAFFSYSNVKVDNIGYMAGLGHKLSNVVAYGRAGPGIIPRRFGIYGGGKDIQYSNITVYNHDFYSNADYFDCSMDNITIISEKFTLSGGRVGTGNRFTNIKLVCTGASNASTPEEAATFHTSNSSGGLTDLMRADNYFENIYIEGFPKLQISYPSVTVKNLTLVNCGWGNSGTFNTRGCVLFLTGTPNLLLDGVNVKFTNANLGKPIRLFWIYSATAAEVKDLVIRNVYVNRFPDGSKGVSNVGTILQDLFIDPIFENIQIPPAISSSTLNNDSTTGKFINCSWYSYYVVDKSRPTIGTTEERPTTYGYGDVYFDKTLQQPIWYSNTGNWVKVDGTLAE